MKYIILTITLIVVAPILAEARSRSKALVNPCGSNPSEVKIKNLGITTTIERLESEGVTVYKVLKYPTSEEFVAILPNGVVINEGGILTETGYILETTRTGLSDQHRLVQNGVPKNIKRSYHFNGRLVVISSPGSENWYHWLLQVLPRLIILSKSEIQYDKIYINNLKYEWQKKSLKAVVKYLNISEDKLLIENRDVVIQAKELIIPSVPFVLIKDRLSSLDNWLKKELHTIFLRTVEDKTAENKTDIIYVARGKAKVRRIINENQLIKALAEKGISTFYLEDLDPLAQARLFNRIKVIIGPHGSGFANLVFASPGVKVVEIDHYTDPIRSLFKDLTPLVGGTYIPYYVDNTTEEHLEDDMEVDIPAFMSFLMLHIKS